MDLPIRLVDEPQDELLISVDGAWGQKGLNLSHWPGNATPRELKHDLSTGIALAFARLATGRRAELARGCVAIANDHVDTDGVCAVFAVRHPERALEREKLLLEVAAAGDLFRWPSDRALVLDLVVAGHFDEERSPWRARFAGLDDRARRELVLRELTAGFDDVLDGDLERYANLWRSELDRAHADRERLAECARDDIVHLDLTVWVDERAGSFDPSRHALCGASDCDRLLALQKRGSGCSARLVLNTTSWFELAAPRLPRPSLEALAARLNELEGTSAGSELLWRAEPTDSPSPELWFGRAGKPMFAEHCEWLEASRLAPTRVRATIVEALRTAWAFPDA